MLLTEKEIVLKKDVLNCSSPISAIEREIEKDELFASTFGPNTPIRFTMTDSIGDGCKCELGVIESQDNDRHFYHNLPSIFNFRKRKTENVNNFVAAMLVPTGIGCDIGGHAADSTPVARLLASVCDTLILHPNVVNASDINEMSDNSLYVEGSVISGLISGVIGLQKVRQNRIALVMGKHPDDEIAAATINAASAARATLGSDCFILKMDNPFTMKTTHSLAGKASGIVSFLDNLFDLLNSYHDKYDAVALASIIEMSLAEAKEYFVSDGSIVNPWGGVEALLTHALTMMYGIPTAHAPMLQDKELLNMACGVVDPRMAAEAVSTAFIHCVLKGLYKSPKIIFNTHGEFNNPEVISAENISCLVIPDKCIGLPTLAAMQQGIPVIAVRENKNIMKNDLTELPFTPNKLFIVDNYLEAAGVMSSLKAGIPVETVRRPIDNTKIIK
jgi:hypothetical protein